MIEQTLEKKRGNGRTKLDDPILPLGGKDALDGKRMPDSAATMNYINLIVCPNVGRGDRRIGSKGYYLSPSFSENYRSIPHAIPLLPYTYDGASYQSLMKIYAGNEIIDAEARRLFTKIGTSVGRDIIRQLERVHDNFMTEIYNAYIEESEICLREIDSFRGMVIPSEEAKRRIARLIKMEGNLQEDAVSDNPLKNPDFSENTIFALKAIEQRHLQRRFLFDFLKKIRFLPFCFFVGRESRCKLETVYLYYEITRIVTEKGQIGSFATETNRTQTSPRILIFSPQKPDALLDWMGEFEEIQMNPRVFKSYVMQLINAVSEIFYGVLPTFEKRYPLQKPVSVPILSVSIQQHIMKDPRFYENERLEQVTLRIREIWNTGIKKCCHGGKLTLLNGRWNAVHWMRSERSLLVKSNTRYSYGIYSEFRKAYQRAPDEAKMFASVMMTALVWKVMRCTTDISYHKSKAKRSEGKLLISLTDVDYNIIINQHTLFNSNLVQWVPISTEKTAAFTAGLKQVDPNRSPLTFFAFPASGNRLSVQQCAKILERSSIAILVNAVVPSNMENVIELPYYALKKDLSYLGDVKLWYHIQDLAYQKLNSGWMAERLKAVDTGTKGIRPAYEGMTPYEKETSGAYKQTGLRGKFSITVKPFLSAAAFYDDFETESTHFFADALQAVFLKKLPVSGREPDWNKVSQRFLLYVTMLPCETDFDSWLLKQRKRSDSLTVWADKKYLYLPYERFWQDFVGRNQDLGLSGDKDVKRKFIQEILPRSYDLIAFASQKNGRLPRADFRRRDAEGTAYSFLRIKAAAVMK